MSTAAGIPEFVRLARQRWNEGRLLLRGQHDAGNPGKRTVHAFSDLLDLLLLTLHREITAEGSLDQRLALVLHGGSGRREFVPYSDVDLMVLHEGPLDDGLTVYAQRLTQAINDAGLMLGFSLRSSREACAAAIKDPVIFSSLTEARFLGGNLELYQTFYEGLQKLSQRRQAALIQGVIAAREQERVKFGETVYLLRPNVKRSRGALRDTHLIRWLGFIRFGQTDIDQLCRHRALSPADATHIHTSTEFLLRVRCDLHFHAGRAQDGLGRNEQVRIAEKFGYQSAPGVLAVESMMQDYFRFTSQIQYICDHFASVSRTRRTLASSMLAPLTNRQVDDLFRITPWHIGVLPESLDRVKTNLQQILRLMQLATLHDKPIEHETWLGIRESMLDRAFEIDESTALQFMALLSNSRKLGDVLQVLHEMRALEKIIPGFAHARGLLQFNEYHKYTVDEHTLQAVRICTDFEQDQTVVGRTYRQLREKHLLHLALLLHDLGKGFEEEHCEVGRRIAEATGYRLMLNPEEVEEVKFLVHNHLMMSHLAFHRNIADEALVAEFAANLGSVKMLSLLYLLTCADIAAVGPGMLTPWKQELLNTLFLQSKRKLTGSDFRDYLAPRQQELASACERYQTDETARTWLKEVALNLPETYLRHHPVDDVPRNLLELRGSDPGHVVCSIRMPEGGRTIELAILKHERIRAGVFYKVTGLLASLGLTIHAAEIKPLGQTLILYWFQCEDDDFAQTPPGRLEEIRIRVERIARGEDDEPPRFRKLWKVPQGPAVDLQRPPIRVEIDNQTVDNATIIDVFAYNKLGLLYTISQKLFQLGLDVHFARISTYGHQVLDVFYVTDDQGNKIRQRQRLKVIRQELAEATREFLEATP
ncbi:MAG: HD domain-containing protein [Planctomycetota bacterium]|jgi:[protein-PII] uridylyltransferase